MTRTLYVTDTHLRGTKPVSRLEKDYLRTQINKLTEVVELARKHQVSAIFHGGDLFDRPDTADAVAREFGKILLAAPCPIIVIGGNHDEFGYNVNSLARTKLGLLDGWNMVRLLHPGQVYWIEADGLKVQVTGQPFHAEIDRRDPVLDYCVRPMGEEGAVHYRHPEADFALHLTHGQLLEQSFLEGTAYTLLSTVGPRTTADVTFGGHYHPGWSKVYDFDGHLWIHPGALVRQFAQRSDYERTVQVALVEFAKGARPRWEFIPLKSAPPAEEVLDMSKSGIEHAREQAEAEFIQIIAEASQLEAANVNDLMLKVAELEKVPTEVCEEALQQLSKAAEELARLEKGEDAA